MAINQTQNLTDFGKKNRDFPKQKSRSHDDKNSPKTEYRQNQQNSRKQHQSCTEVNRVPAEHEHIGRCAQSQQNSSPVSTAAGRFGQQDACHQHPGQAVDQKPQEKQHADGNMRTSEIIYIAAAADPQQNPAHAAHERAQSRQPEMLDQEAHFPFQPSQHKKSPHRIV